MRFSSKGISVGLCIGALLGYLGVYNTFNEVSEEKLVLAQTEDVVNALRVNSKSVLTLGENPRDAITKDKNGNWEYDFEVKDGVKMDTYDELYVAFGQVRGIVGFESNVHLKLPNKTFDITPEALQEVTSPVQLSQYVDDGKYVVIKD